MHNPINQSQLKEMISVTAENLNIKHPSIIEKDYYVTQLIHVFSKIESDFFRLTFSGGTCLAKAHKIVKRMSEDIDFKIQIKNDDTKFSKNQLLKELKKFRSQITSALSLPGLTVGNTSVRNEGRYSHVELTYPALFATNETLRPHLLLEFTLSDVRLSTKNESIKTLIEDSLNIEISEAISINCVSVVETAIEKWVALTRRIGAIERQYYPDDPTMIRHLYDLNAIERAGKISAQFFDLSRVIINQDAAQFKNQYPEYFINSSAEIQKSLTILRNKKLWEERYQTFVDVMVYDKSAIPVYDNAMQLLETLSKKIIKNL